MSILIVDAMPFLTAEWRDLAILNWEVPRELLTNSIPRGTQLDTFDGRAFVSLVAFRFVNTRVMNLAIPWHANFDEVNLRFYVKRRLGGDVRRGVVFLKEIVARPVVAFVARCLYGENYAAASMSHEIEHRDRHTKVEYSWAIQGSCNSVSVGSDGGFKELLPGSTAEFILEHYWGYCRRRDGGATEYRVSHPKWQVAAVEHFSIHCDFMRLYGEELGGALASPPVSVFLADGSPVEVGFGKRF